MTSKVKAALDFYADDKKRGLKKMGTFAGGEVYGDALLIDNGEKAQEALTELQPIPGLREAVANARLYAGDDKEHKVVCVERLKKLEDAAMKWIEITEGE